MSRPPYDLQDHHHNTGSSRKAISPLKINRDSCNIKKSSSSLFVNHQQAEGQEHHHPVIIYTHSPKVIRTNPRDFMSLVQKLTGLSGHHHPNPHPNTSTYDDEHESTLDENNNGSCSAGVSTPGRPTFDRLNSTTIDENEGGDSQDIFNDLEDSLDFLCSAKEPPISNYTDSFFFTSTIETSITSSSFESMKEFSHF
ncbi:hypothetical protein P3S68_005933 [Capsicum galapagoense]